MSRKLKLIVFSLLCGLLILNSINLGLAAMTDTVATDFEYDVVPNEVVIWQNEMSAVGTYSMFNDETYETEPFDESEFAYNYVNVSSIDVIDDTHANITVDTYHNNTVDPTPSLITDWTYYNTQSVIVNNTKVGLLSSGIMILPNDVFMDDIADNDLNLLLFRMFEGLLEINPNEFAETVALLGGTVYKNDVTKSYDAIPYRLLYSYSFDGDAVIIDGGDELGINMTFDFESDMKMNAKHLLNEIDITMDIFMRYYLIDNATMFEQQDAVYTASMDLIYDSIATDPTPEEVSYDFEEPTDLMVWVWTIVGIVGAGAITIGVIYGVGNRTACKEGKSSSMCFKKYLSQPEEEVPAELEGALGSEPTKYRKN